MALSLQEIRARAKAAEERKKNPQGGFEKKPDAFLAHWNIPENTAFGLRFLPDGNQNADYPWKERRMINLTFSGIKGGEQKPVRITVPCNEMWGPVNSCPVLAELRTWDWNDQTMKDIASKYWPKKSWIMQCFIAPGSENIVQDDMAPENPIRRVIVNKEIFDLVYQIYVNDEVEHLPVDYVHGRDFNIMKTKNGGGFAEYNKSAYKFSERALNAQELEAIEKFGLFDLSDFMPKQPTAEELNAIKEMFEASIDGEQYDPERWAQYYRPAGVPAPSSNGNSHSKPSESPSLTAEQQAQALAALSKVNQETVTQPVVSTPVPQAEAPAANLSTADLLAKIRARGNTNAQ